MTPMYVSPDFLTHHKTEALIRALGECAPLYVLRIWSHCEARKAWTFTISPEALKALCRHAGNANQLVAALTASGFVRLDGSTLIVHQWEEYNADLARKWAKEPKPKPPPVPKPPPPPKAASGRHIYSASFEAWWKAYPRKVGKDKANLAYASAGKRVKVEKNVESVAAAALLLEAATAYAASEEGQSEFCPHPATWLNAGRWNDDREQWKRDEKVQKKKPPKLNFGDLDDA